MRINGEKASFAINLGRTADEGPDRSVLDLIHEACLTENYTEQPNPAGEELAERIRQARVADSEVTPELDLSSEDAHYVSGIIRRFIEREHREKKSTQIDPKKIALAVGTASLLAWFARRQLHKTDTSSH